MIKPKRLKRGDTVGVIAPASPPNIDNLERGIEFLEQELGLKVKRGKNLTTQYGYLAGQDEDRLHDLHDMFADQEVKAIFSACGGYGTARLASSIDFELIKRYPKIFWGYSDLTFLHTAFRQNANLVTYHGPMLASDIGKEEVDPLSKKMFSQLFEPSEFTYFEEYSKIDILVEGKAKGQLVGGNLSLLSSSMGTPFEIDTKDKLLLIEDINEEPRAVDRMLNQLFMAGKLQETAGILVGDFHDCEPQRELSLSLDEVIDYYIKKAGKPSIKGLIMGHCSPHIAVPFGVMAELDSTSKTIKIESGVE